VAILSYLASVLVYKDEGEEKKGMTEDDNFEDMGDDDMYGDEDDAGEDFGLENDGFNHD
jgi:hypothetical protein